MTQLEAAQKGKITSEMREVAENEQIAVEQLRELIAAGRVIIPFNKNHDKCRPRGIGEKMCTKINANIGASQDVASIDVELKKVDICEHYGADFLMDLSAGVDNLDEIRRTILSKTYIPVGTVPIYQMVTESSFTRWHKVVGDVLERQAQQGVSYFTIHAGFKRDYLELVKDRVCGIVSRGGGIIEKWMRYHNQENPLYTHFDEILEIMRKYDVTMSLGDTLRPGGIADAGDRAQYAELETLGELTKRCWKAGVQVMVEGPGHVPIHQIEEQMNMQKKLCHGAPYYVLGPLVCDIGAPYDHITGAIGATVAAMHGAHFLCYITPAEHVRLPTVEDVRAGVIAWKIAAHAGDIARGIPGARKIDDEMSFYRKKFNWYEQRRRVFDKEKFDEYLHVGKLGRGACTMCGELCPMQEDIPEGEAIHATSSAPEMKETVKQEYAKSPLDK